MIHRFEENIACAKQGKDFFQRKFDFSKLSIADSFLLVLTDNEVCIQYGIKYLKDFIELYHRKNVYVLLKDSKYAEKFSEVGGKTIICTETDLKNLAHYLSIFLKRDQIDTRIILLSEKDDFGFPVKELLSRKEFSLEEYVAVCLYQLDEIKEGK